MAPAITQQPSGTNIIAGRTAKFTVAATGTLSPTTLTMTGGQLTTAAASTVALTGADHPEFVSSVITSTSIFADVRSG